jgi:hypothetical protein
MITLLVHRLDKVESHISSLFMNDYCCPMFSPRKHYGHVKQCHSLTLLTLASMIRGVLITY